MGQFAANVRSKREPEPYNGKGIKYRDEMIIRKQGKVVRRLSAGSAFGIDCNERKSKVKRHPPCGARRASAAHPRRARRPRLTVFRSSKHIYAQVIDDLKGHTICFASTNEKSNRADNGGNCDAATEVGKRLAERAKEAGVGAVVFDRNGYRVPRSREGARRRGSRRRV